MERATRGAEVGKAGRMLGKRLMPWQQYSADVALEVDPATGDLWYEEVIITVPRQSGKTTLILAVLVWRCIVMALELGPQTCTYIAQSLKMARRKLEREFARLMRGCAALVEIPQLSKQRPLEEAEWKLSMNNGSEHIAFGTNSYLQIEAPTELGSHGDVLDVSVTDEAWAREDDAVEEATDAATITRRSPQSWIISTAGNKRSRFLARKVLAGRRLVQDPEALKTSRTCYLEWSVPDDARWDDPKVWARFLPALGHTITVARLKARLEKAQRNPDEVEEDGYEPGVAGFKRGYLNIWPEFPTFGDSVDFKPEIADSQWAELLEEDSAIIGRVAFGVGVSRGGASASIVVAGYTRDGRAQVETIEHSDGTWWLERVLREKCEKWSPTIVAWDDGGDARMVKPEIHRASQTGIPPAELLALNGVEWKAACAATRQRIIDARIVHVGDLHLTDALAGMTRVDVGDGWRWNVKEARADSSPVTAMTAALRALELMPEPAPHKPVFAA